MSHDNHHDSLKLALKLAKLGLKAAGVCAAFLTVKELHKVHKAIEHHHHHEH